jgi:hypothetical protein
MSLELRMKFAAAGLLCLFLGTQSPAQNIQQTFQNPPKAYRPMVRWWWPGGDVTDKELRREVDLLDQANFGGGEIQPFQIGLSPTLPEAVAKRVNDYLTPTFFAHMGAALSEAQARGMWLDYTFGSGWPFGGAGAITPELASVELRSAQQTIRGPVKFHQQIQVPQSSPDLIDERFPSGWRERFQKREKLVAVVAVRGASVQYFPNQSAEEPPVVKRTGQLDPATTVLLTDHLQPDGTLDWDVPPGTWQVFTFKEMPTAQDVVGGVGGGPQLVLDHMNRNAFDVYAQHVGGTAKQYDGQYFGHGLRAIFCDSLEVQAYLYWSDDFLRQFRQRRGYDLTPYLPILKVPGFGLPYGSTGAHMPLYDIPGIGDRIRRDYWQTVSDVMIENFYTPFNQWAANNNLLSRVQAHGSPTDLLRVYGAANIPETEDLLDQGRYDFLKMSSSGADLYGRKIVASESFVWHGKAYQTTPEKIKRFADELLTAGINEVIYHGYPYEYMDRPEPGWHPFAKEGAFSSLMNQHNYFWPYLSGLNEYITRLQYISQTGTTVAPVALYRGALAYDSIEPPPPEPEIDTRLMDAGYNFDHIDAYVLLHCHVANNRLISPGGASYGVLVLPDQKIVSSKVADQLAAFAKDGLPIVFVGSTPVVERKIVDGKLIDASASQGNFTGKNMYMANDSVDVVKVLDRAAIPPNLHFEGRPVPFIEKRVGRLDAFFLRNPDDSEKQVTASFTATGTPEIWDPWTGLVHPLKHFERQGNVLHARLNIDAYGSKLLVFDPDAKPVQSAPIADSSQPSVQLTIGENGWKFHGVGIGPASKPETVDMELPHLVDWSTNSQLKNFSGRGEYTTTFNVPADFLATHPRILLDLGEVKDVAEISIDGHAGPVLLLRPYKADVTALVHAGENTLRITVVNTLYNALSANGRSANYDPETTNTENGLMSSGLIGPVRLSN